MDGTGMNTQLLTQTLVESFNALADEVQNLSDRQTVLEHKLRYAHEQVIPFSSFSSSSSAATSASLLFFAIPYHTAILDAVAEVAAYIIHGCLQVEQTHCWTHSAGVSLCLSFVTYITVLFCLSLPI